MTNKYNEEQVEIRMDPVKLLFSVQYPWHV